MASRRDVALGVAGLLAGCNSRREPPLPQSRTLLTRTTRFPLRLAPGERYPVCADGSPFLLHGDTAWSLIADASREDAVAYIEDRAGRGFNTILVNLIEARFASHAPNNRYGEPPFLTADDFAAPNEAYFEHADFVLQTAREHGMLVLLAPAYLGAGGGDQGWYQQMRRNSLEQLRYYGRYVATRYAHYDNILWVAGGDFDPPDKRLTRAVSAGVRDSLPRSLQTAHCHRGVSALECWPGEDWLNVNSVYAGGDAVAASLGQYARGAPFFFIEGRYEQAPSGDRATLRRQAYGPLLSGSFGHVYGNEDVWHFDGPGVFRRTTDWRDALDSPGARDMQLVWRFFSGLRWTLLEPDVDGRFLADGRQQGETMAAAAVASDGSFAVLYAPTPRALAVNAARLAAPLARARWYDPTSGAWSSAAFARDGERARFQVRPTNAGGDEDWVLLLEA